MDTPLHRPEPAARQGRARLALLGFLAVAAFFLATEHTAHLFGALPFLLLLLCPFLHLFMHRGHEGHGGHGGGRTEPGPAQHDHAGRSPDRSRPGGTP